MNPTWQPFDYEDKKRTAPPVHEPVWIHEAFYSPRETTIGIFDGYTMRMLPGGSDDCHVTHWRRMDPPPPPPRWNDPEQD